MGSFLDMVSRFGTKWSGLPSSTWSDIEDMEATSVQRRANFCI